MKNSKVLFTKKIDGDSLVNIYESLDHFLEGKVAIKISTGEPGGNNYLKPSLIKKIVQQLNGTIVECNTAYKGRRYTTKDHLQAAKDHGFMEIAEVDIMDSDSDMAIPVANGKYLTENYVGSNLALYDSILMLSHFKGHAMGGYGGALKNASIGIASTRGKTLIHSAGKVDNADILWENIGEQDDFLSSMAEAAKSVADYKKDIVYINVMNLMSIDCDCDSNPADPKISDIGILASLDPVALDQACIDLIYSLEDDNKADLVNRIEEKHGLITIEYAETIGLGTRKYDLVSID